MKKIIIMTTVLLSLLITLIGCEKYTSNNKENSNEIVYTEKQLNKVIKIKDENLKKIILTYLKKEDDYILTRKDLLSIISLRINDDVKTTDGLEYCDNIEYVAINGRKSSINIESLRKLKNLKYVTLYPCNSNDGDTNIDLSKYNGLNKLENIEYLGVDLSTVDINQLNELDKIKGLSILGYDSEEFPDISGMKSLTNLVINNLINNNEIIIDEIAKLTNLKTLSIRVPWTSNIDWIRNLKNLESLYLSSDDNIESIGKLKKLKNLYLAYSCNEDISFIGNLSELESLYLCNNTMRDITSITKLSNLKSLYLESDSVDNIELLNNMTSLEELELCEIEVMDIKNILNLTNLKSLTINSDSVINLNLITKMNNLEVLKLSDCGIEDITPIADLQNIKELVLDFNPITNINLISELTNLESLSLSNCGIKDISFVSNLVNLKDLDLGNLLEDNSDIFGEMNIIKDINPILNLRELEYLNLKYTKVDDVTALESLPQLSISY